MLPNDVINVPISSEPEQLNLLVNKIFEDANGFFFLFQKIFNYIFSENWLPTNFDFLIDSLLLKTSIFDFVELYKFSLEDVINVECIEQTSAPKPFVDLIDNEWIADLCTIDMNL